MQIHSWKWKYFLVEYFFLRNDTIKTQSKLGKLEKLRLVHKNNVAVAVMPSDSGALPLQAHEFESGDL